MPQSLAVIVKNKRRALEYFSALVLVLAFSGELIAKEITLYVSPKGNDAWSGRKVNPSWNRKDGPFATLPAAIKAVRDARIQSEDARIKIFIRGGIYELAEPLVLKSEDSGASGTRPFLIAAYRGEKPIISGGRKITGWKRVEGKTNLWSVEIPEVREGKWFFRQLFVNGQRRTRARTPNVGFYQVQGNISLSKPATFKFAAGEIKKGWVADAEISGFSKWVNYRMQIRDVDEASRTVTLSGVPHDSSIEPNSRYFVENISDALDQPGEWFLDRKTGVITYLAAAGEDLSKAEVVAPRLTELLRLGGDSYLGQCIWEIQIRNITFAYADWSLPDTGYADTQAAHAVPAAVSADGAIGCIIQNCTFEHLGGYALDFGRGCHRNKIIGNEICDIGAGGVRLGETVVRTNSYEMNFGNVISDNHIHELGRVYASAVGILILHSATNHIAHNEIHDLFYTAISVGWRWGYEENPCRENLIEFNHLYDIGQGLLSDMGGIYTLGIQRGTVLRNNVIHDVNSFNYGGWGLYTDEGSSHILLESNLVYRCNSAGFHQHYGRENILRNNIFALNLECQIVRTRAEPHTSFFFTNNIVYFNSGQLFGGDWTGGQFVMDRNIYFDARPSAATNSFHFAGMTFEDWQKRGHDSNSIIADPEFVAPEKFDFRLKKNSPALKMGFKPINLRDVGVRKDRKSRMHTNEHK